MHMGAVVDVFHNGAGVGYVGLVVVDNGWTSQRWVGAYP